MNVRLWVCGCLGIGVLAGACVPRKGNTGTLDSGRPAGGTDGRGPGATAVATRPVEVQEQRWPNGTLASRVEGYVGEDGKFARHGVSAEWYENGQQKLELHWKDGVQHGPRLTWYDNGQIWGQGAYVNGREDGIWTAWWPNGFKSVEWTMREGAFHGTYTEWHSNGEKRREFEYVNGAKQGPVVVWDEEGNEQFRGEYVNDALQP